MELMDAIRNRRTVRTFRPDSISDEVLNEILEAGMWAPSHANRQTWEFVIIGPSTRQQLAKLYQDMVHAGPLKNPTIAEEHKQSILSFSYDFGGAPLLMAVTCPSAHSDMDRYDYPLAAACAVHNIFLAAWEKQIAGIWLSFGYAPQTQELLGIQPGGSIAGILAMGYTDKVPKAPPRIPAHEKIRRLP